jgi:hypothetical protein
LRDRAKPTLDAALKSRKNAERTPRLAEKAKGLVLSGPLSASMINMTLALRHE